MNKLNYYNFELLKKKLTNRINHYILAYNRLYNYYNDPNLYIRYMVIKLPNIIEKMLSNVKQDLEYCDYIELKALLYSIYE